MRKSDFQLQRDVIDALRWDPRTAAAEVGVAVKNGVVTLAGQVDSFAKKFALVRAAERVGGVQTIANEVVVELPASFARSDIDIAHAVANVFEWDVHVPNETIKARVEHGWIWLEGDADWQYQARAAERAVRNLIGVKGVTNLIRARQQEPKADDCLATTV